eukprot:TRINITY_DN1243_c0_g1_i1.p1 TRINITY_DN1243_c0_g1~~TRINITY_DN1243_c0_g1_i1.p1  ORF type:complete len:194 (+),score=73.00 TRINITY_DN1243_c0_g1_i1:11-592(+)
MLEMSSDSGIGSSPEAPSSDVPPMSRTYQYRKIMKPLLERKRRARINKCLEDLKDIMVSTLQAEGESITKLEKADVLELTVRHLKKLKAANALRLPEPSEEEEYAAGYASCSLEVGKFLSESKVPIDPSDRIRLLTYLDSQVLLLKKKKKTKSRECPGGSIGMSSRPNSAFSPVVPKEERMVLGGNASSWRPW